MSYKELKHKYLNFNLCFCRITRALFNTDIHLEKLKFMILANDLKQLL